MKWLRLFRISLAELFVLTTFVAVSCVALLNSSDTTAWVIGGLFWLAILVAIAGVAAPAVPRRPFFIGFLAASLLHVYLMQLVATRGHSNHDIDLPTFYFIELLWSGIPNGHWPKGASAARTVQGAGGIYRVSFNGLSPFDAAHANFQGIATQLFSMAYGMFTGFLAQSLAYRATAKSVSPSERAA